MSGMEKNCSYKTEFKSGIFLKKIDYLAIIWLTPITICRGKSTST